MKEGVLEETNMSMISSRSKSRSRSRSTSSNRTITSTSSIESVGEMYQDGSRSSSPIFSHDNPNGEIVCKKRCQITDKNTDNNPNKKMKTADNDDLIEFKHSTPVLSEYQQKQKLFDHYTKAHTYNAMAAAAAAAAAQNYYANKNAYMNANSPISSLKLLNCKIESPILHHHQHQAQQDHKPLSLCAVCGDRASGKHYGVLSCDGCRGFFKRSIRGNMEYVCKENQKCIIDVSRRNQCQSCRLKKCLEVKMNKDAVQHQRPPRSHQIRRDSNASFVQQQQQQQQMQTTANISFENNKCNAQPFYNNIGLTRYPPSLPPPPPNYSSHVTLAPYLTPGQHAYLSQNQMTSLASAAVVVAAAAASSQPSVPWNPFFSTSYSNNNNSSTATKNDASFTNCTSSLSSASSSSSSSQSPLTASIMPSSLTTSMTRFLPATGSHPLPIRQLASQSSTSIDHATPNNHTIPSTTSPNISTTSSGYSTSEDVSMNDDKDGLIKTKTMKKEVIEPSNKQISPKKSQVNEVPLPVKSQPIDWNHTMQLPTDNVYEIATRILFAAVKWARTQRSFIGLPFTDQVILLEESWPELFVLTAAEFRPFLNENTFMMKFNEPNVERKKTLQNFFDNLSRFTSHHVDPVEFMLLKSIILFKSDTKELRDKAKIDAIQEEILNTLLNHDKVNYNSTSRFGRLLLLVADAKQFTSKILEDTFFRNVLGTTNSIDNLLFDIFKSC